MCLDTHTHTKQLFIHLNAFYMLFWNAQYFRKKGQSSFHTALESRRDLSRTFPESSCVSLQHELHPLRAGYEEEWFETDKNPSLLSKALITALTIDLEWYLINRCSGTISCDHWVGNPIPPWSYSTLWQELLNQVEKQQSTITLLQNIFFLFTA